MGNLRIYKSVLLLLLCALYLIPASALTSIGRMALIVGEVKRTDSQGRTDILRMGATISQGDRIITGLDSIAMIVFIDDGRLSLRSESELIIKQYQVDNNGVDNQLNFQLVRGAMRQISGKAATLQPERYRLNTPIASIGVRGTDFLAKTSSSSLETFIQEGAIVLHSNQAHCFEPHSAAASCSPFAHLAASDTERYLKIFSDGQMERRNVPAEEIKQTFGISITKAPTASAPTAVAENNSKDTSTQIYAGFTDKEDLGKPSQEVLLSLDVKGGVPDRSIESSLVDTSTVVGTTTPLQKTVAPLSNHPDYSRQLVWGNFNAGGTPLFALVGSHQQASDGRHVTVGEVWRYGLFRNGAKDGFGNTLKGETQFGLHAGEAHFMNGAKTLTATISNPILGINFDRATFTTQLTLNQAQIGSTMLQATGKINDQGIFVNRTTGQELAGAISQNGQEAGYFFSKDYADGTFKGVTLWNAR